MMYLLQIWDRRHGDHPIKQVPIHNGPVYCCDWHLENDNWILSAGRDKMIKVCTMRIFRLLVRGQVKGSATSQVGQV